MSKKYFFRNCIEEAIKTNKRYIGLVLESYDGEEVIIISREHFGKKMAYYLDNFDENLCLNKCADVKVTLFTSADNFDDIEIDLIG